MSRMRAALGLLVVAGVVTLVVSTWPNTSEDASRLLEDAPGYDPSADLAAADPPLRAVVPAVPREALHAANADLLDGEPTKPQLSLLGRVRGRLAWQGTGLPLPDATVRAVRAWPDTVLINEIELATRDQPPLRRADLFVGEPATTDAFGLFEVALPEVDGPVALLALRNGQCIEVRPLQPPPAAREAIELGDWLLQPRGEVRGRVVDARDGPIAGARVRLVDVPIEHGPSLHPLARAARLCGARDFTPDGLLFEENCVVTVSGALAARDDLLPFPEATTDAGGYFTLTDARPGANTLIVQPQAAPHLAEQVLVSSSAVTEVGLLRIPDGGSHGRLLSGSGHPVARGQVAFQAHDGDVFLPPRETSADGAFYVPQLVQAPGMAVARRTLSEPWQPCTVTADKDVLYVTLPEPARLVVDVLGPDRSSMAGCDVQARHARVFGRGFETGMQLEEVGPGRYARVIPAGVTSLVVVRADGYAPAVDLVGSEARFLLFLRTCTLQVRVRTQEGAPAERAQVYGRVRAGKERGQRWDLLRTGHVRLGETDVRGELLVPGVWPSIIDLVVSHPELGAAERVVEIGDGGSVCDVMLGVSTRGRIRGLLTENRLPPQDRWLVVAQLEDPYERRCTLSERDGSFAFDGLLSGNWKLGVAVRAGPLPGRELVARVWQSHVRRRWASSTPEIPVVAGAIQHTTMDVRNWADERELTLEGRVRIDGVPRRGLIVLTKTPDEPAREERFAELLWQIRQPLPAQRRARLLRELNELRARAEGRTPIDMTTTDDTGAFAFALYESTELEVLAQIDGFTQCLWSGEHHHGAVIDIATGSALVELRAGAGDLLAHRMLEALGLGDRTGVRWLAVTNGLGTLSFDGIPRGEYVLRPLGATSTLRFPSPTFIVTGPDWRRSSVVAR
jgi:hypothetical protein